MHTDAYLRVIGRRQCPERNTLMFVAEASMFECFWRFNFVLEDFTAVYSYLRENLAFLQEFPIKQLESLELDYLESLQKQLNLLLENIVCRWDVLSDTSFSELVRIPEGISFPITPKLLESSKVTNYYLTSICWTPPFDSLLLSSGVTEAHSVVGYLWSFIQPTDSGEWLLLGKDPSLFVLSSGSFNETLTCCFWEPSMKVALFGTRSGQLLVFESKTELTPNRQGIYDEHRLKMKLLGQYRLHEESITGIASLERFLVTTGSDNVIKVSRCKF